MSDHVPTPVAALPLSGARREEIKHLAQLATPGPWLAGHLAADDSTCNCPWITSQGYAGAICTVEVDNGLRIAEGGNDSPPLEEAKANLRYLAAASPEVLLAYEAALATREAEAAGLKQELAEQEKEKLELVKENQDLRKLLQAGKEYLALTRPGRPSPLDVLPQGPTAQLQDRTTGEKPAPLSQADLLDLAKCVRREATSLYTVPLFERLLFEHADLAARLAEAQTAFSELRGQVTGMLEDFTNGCQPVQMQAGVKTTPYWLTVNSERARNLQWAELKCTELGIVWPIKPIPYTANLPSEPPPCLQDCTSSEKGGLAE